MNKSVMKCCICNNENIGQFITINNKKYHLCCIEQLQQENKKLNGTIQTYDVLLKANVEENKQLQERMEYLERSNNRREDIIIEQRQEISDLEDNWDELKEYLEEWKENEEYCYLASSPIDRCRKDIYGEVLDKMQELQGSDSNE